MHEVVAPDALDGKVAELAKALVNAGPQAIGLCKKLVQEVAAREITPALIDSTVKVIADVRVSTEGREGLQSFLHKRKPNWMA